MADETPKMHINFPRWYAPVSLGNDEQRKLARWAAVSRLAKDAERERVEPLIRLLFSVPRHPAKSDAVEAITAVIVGLDDTFDAKNAGREIQLLAGACLNVLIDDGGDIGAAAALSITTASFEHGRVPDVPIDIAALAESAIDRLSETTRARPDLSGHMSVKSPQVDLGTVALKAKAANPEELGNSVGEAGKALQAALNQLTARHISLSRGIARYFRVQDEELQVLWWLIGGRSRDLDRDFSSIAADQQAFVLAKELADDTQIMPGLRSIKALLLRAGLKKKNLTILSAVNGHDSGWLAQLVNEAEPSPLTCPIHFAIKRQVEAGGGDTWVANWAAVVGVDAARTLSALTMSTLFYRERLLMLFG